MIYIISYPKTGRTWLRVLIGKSLCEIYNLPDEEIINTSSKSVTAGMPHTVYSHDGSAMIDKKPYHVLTSDKSYYRDKKFCCCVATLKTHLCQLISKLQKGLMSLMVRSLNSLGVNDMVR